MSRADTRPPEPLVTDWAWERLLQQMRQRAKEHRRASGTSHRAIAQATARSVRTSMRWFSGDVPLDLRVLVTMAKLFGCKVSDLTGLP